MAGLWLQQTSDMPLSAGGNQSVADVANANSSARSWPGALRDHRQLPGSEVQWLLSGGELEWFNFSTMPKAVYRG